MIVKSTFISIGNPGQEFRNIYWKERLLYICVQENRLLYMCAGKQIVIYVCRKTEGGLTFIEVKRK
jgi:hypothetical protein